MPRTMILEPLSESDLDEDVADMLKEALGRIRSLLNSMNADETMTFVEFLEKLDLTEQQYIKAIRLSLKHSTLLLKRSPSEIRINCYNPHLLKAWRANMDIQFVLDPYVWRQLVDKNFNSSCRAPCSHFSSSPQLRNSTKLEFVAASSELDESCISSMRCAFHTLHMF